MSEDDQGIEKTKRRGCHNEHVDRRNVGQVVVQKAAPGRGGDFGPPRQVSADRGLADLDAELEEFTLDAGAPQSRWPGSSGGSDHGSRGSSWAVPDGVVSTNEADRPSLQFRLGSWRRSQPRTLFGDRRKNPKKHKNGVEVGKI